MGFSKDTKYLLELQGLMMNIKIITTDAKCPVVCIAGSLSVYFYYKLGKIDFIISHNNKLENNTISQLVIFV
jgi:hypothetical protein